MGMGVFSAERAQKCQAPIKSAQPFPAQNCGQKFCGHHAFSDKCSLQIVVPQLIIWRNSASHYVEVPRLKGFGAKMRPQDLTGIILPAE